MAYLFARAHAERVGAELQIDPWIGEKVFDVPVNRVTEASRNLPRRSSIDIRPDETDVDIRCYAQCQEAMIYTKSQARSWLKFKLSSSEIFNDPEAAQMAKRIPHTGAAHRRVGDYLGAGYPVVSEKSIFNAVDKFRLFECPFVLLTEEKPVPRGNLSADIQFLPDFYWMCHAPFLLRGNSSFSWTAGLLNPNRVFSPVIAHLAGGREHDVDFIEGNYSPLSDRTGGTPTLHVYP